MNTDRSTRLTLTAKTILFVSLVAVGVGLFAGWIEPLALGSVGLLIVIFARVVERTQTTTLVLDPLPTTVGRGTALAVTGRIADGPETSPDSALAETASMGTASIELNGQPTPLVVERDHTVRLRLPTGRRGPISIGATRLTSVDRLGLCSTTSISSERAEVLVLPHITPLNTLASQGDDRSMLRGFSDGDDARWIHPMTSARSGSLMVRPPDRLGTGGTTLIFDLDAEAYNEVSFEHAVDIVASLAAAGHAHHAWPEIVIGGQPFQGGLDDLLRELALVKPTGGGTAHTMPLTDNEVIVVTGRRTDRTDRPAVATPVGLRRGCVISVGSTPAPTVVSNGIAQIQIADSAELAAAWAMRG